MRAQLFLSTGFLTLYSGLDLLEYMYFCEDLGMEPIMAVWAGRYPFSDLRVMSKLYRLFFR